jgi:hypothetical protein
VGIDVAFNELLGLIDQHGWAVRHVLPRVGEEGCPFSYTIGLTAMHHPEVVVYVLADRQRPRIPQRHRATGQRWPTVHAGLITTDFTENALPMAFMAVQDTIELTAVERVYGHVDALQLVWPNASGIFPWQPGYGLPPSVQPLLGPWLH